MSLGASLPLENFCKLGFKPESMIKMLPIISSSSQQRMLPHFLPLLLMCRTSTFLFCFALHCCVLKSTGSKQFVIFVGSIADMGALCRNPIIHFTAFPLASPPLFIYFYLSFHFSFLFFSFFLVKQIVCSLVSRRTVLPIFKPHYFSSSVPNKIIATFF